MRKVTLKRVSLASTGIYRCEVTSKLKPAGIDSEVREDRMVVLGEFLLRDNQNPYLVWKVSYTGGVQKNEPPTFRSSN